MSFEAKKLRVQLPCGTDGSVIKEAIGGDGGDCDWPTGCRVFTCEWGTDCLNVFWTTPLQVGTVNCQYASCNLGLGTCPADSCPNYSCTFPSPCRFGTCGHLGSCRAVTGIGPATIEEGSIVVDADQLPVLRERLEAQLKEIENAERAVRERRESEE